MSEKTVFVTVGPRGSGKSTFCERIISKNPNVTLISRDKILMSLFGDVCLSPYSGGHQYAYSIMWKMVGEHLNRSANILILDVWNGYFDERKYIIDFLRKLGAEKIIALYFITPVSSVEKWFWQKPEVVRSHYLDTSPVHDHILFHRLARGICSNGFDQVLNIDPENNITLREFTLKTGLVL